MGAGWQQRLAWPCEDDYVLRETGLFAEMILRDLSAVSRANMPKHLQLRIQNQAME
jgi:hypothetical protein